MDQNNKPCLSGKYKMTLTTWDRQQQELENLTRRFSTRPLTPEPQLKQTNSEPECMDEVSDDEEDSGTDDDGEQESEEDIDSYELHQEFHFLIAQKHKFEQKKREEGLPPWETFFQDEINKFKDSTEGLTVVQETSSNQVMLFNPVYPQESIGILRQPQHRVVDKPYSICYGERIQGYEPGIYKPPPHKISIPILVPNLDDLEDTDSEDSDDYTELIDELFDFEKNYRSRLADIEAETPPEIDLALTDTELPSELDAFDFLDENFEDTDAVNFSYLNLDEEECPWNDNELNKIDTELRLDLSSLNLGNDDAYSDSDLSDGSPTSKRPNLQHTPEGSTFGDKDFSYMDTDDITPINSPLPSPPNELVGNQTQPDNEPVDPEPEEDAQFKDEPVKMEEDLQPNDDFVQPQQMAGQHAFFNESSTLHLQPLRPVQPFDAQVLFACLSRLRTAMEEDGRKGGGGDSPDLTFVYDDTDTHGNEISELYSYTEQPELQLNVKAFEDQMEAYGLAPSWQRLPVERRKSVIMKLLDQLEMSQRPLRMRSARCLLYICQGCWAEMQSDTEQQHWARLNSILLYQLGTFSAFVDLLNIEIENATAAHVAMRKIAVSLADSQDLRVILSVLYTITEVIRNEMATENTEYKSEIEAFCYDIANAAGEDLLVLKLLGMVTRFCSGAAPHFPMKKVLLLLWKLILVSLGGMAALRDLKAEKRMKAGLPPQDEDTMEIAKTMRSSSPPASASDLLEAQNQKRNTRPFRRSLIKQSSLDDQDTIGLELVGNDNGDDLTDMNEYDERRPADGEASSQLYQNQNVSYSCPASPPTQHDVLPRGLPWKPKVRQKDIDMFLDGSRLKFLGYSLPGDSATLFGLPEPIHEGVKILKEHVYTSLAELQIQKEEEIARNPLSTLEDQIEMTPAEILYQAMLPNLPQYMIALLKILLAAAPTSKAKTDSINIMADVLPEEMPMTVLQSMKLGIDVNRHKEIIVKAVSAILLLLLKHFKLNHVYQFEFMSQHLVFANCIPLVLKFFNQTIMAYVGAKNVIPILDFPSCVIGDQPELTAESLEIGDAAPFSWRNMFSCINLLRILNKLTKWKHSRIMMLVVFKSAPILKRTLKVRHAMTQLYVLKLLKMQTKYLGRQWRKSNMKTISAIYQKVRHRLNDDWAYGNDLDARPWDFQAEECALRASVDRFNNRRYTQIIESEFEPVDNCIISVLGDDHELSKNFKEHYALWLEQEVFGAPVDWDKLLLNNK